MTKSPVKALVVDDSSLSLKLITAFLHKLGCSFDIAINGQEAVEKAKNNHYDICFMDIEMPIMGGLEATKVIRKEISKDLPIVAVTAVIDFTQEKGAKAGMNDLIRKPVDAERIKRALSQYTTKKT